MGGRPSVIKAIRSLGIGDKIRLFECLNCPYHKECDNSVDNPMDNPDGTCMTKQKYEFENFIRRKIMIGDYKHVHFDEWCKKCEYEKYPEEDENCAYCLDHPVNVDSHKPVNFKKKIRR